jgi:GntR family transcriptional regulator
LKKQDEALDRVLDLIERLQVGEAIPSERQLSKDLGMSRLTVRAAIDRLVQDGRLSRRHGSGTFVTEPKIAQRLSLNSFSEEMRLRGMVPGSRVIELASVPADARLAQRLELSPGERVVRAKRLRLADGAPMALELMHVPAKVVSGLVKGDLENASFYDLMRDRYDVVISQAVQTIEPTVTDEEQSRFLGVPLHSPAFLFERTARSQTGQTVEYSISIYRGDRYRFVAELTPQRRPIRHFSVVRAATPSRNGRRRVAVSVSRTR